MKRDYPLLNNKAPENFSNEEATESCRQDEMSTEFTVSHVS